MVRPTNCPSSEYFSLLIYFKNTLGFPGDPVIKGPPYNAGGTSLTLVQEKFPRYGSTKLMYYNY